MAGGEEAGSPDTCGKLEVAQLEASSTLHALHALRQTCVKSVCTHAGQKFHSLGVVAQVVRRLEAQTHVKVAQLEATSMLRTLNAFKQAIMLCDVASRGWPVLHANDALLHQLGEARSPTLNGSNIFWMKCAPLKCLCSFRV